MNIIEFLRDQHDEVKDALNEILVRHDPGELRSLLETMSLTLRLHMKIEETLVYPVAQRIFEGDRTKPSVLQSLDEHELAKQCLGALESTPPTDEHFVPRAKVLKNLLREHILEEESDLFPSLMTKLGQAGIDRLSEEVEQRMPALEDELAALPPDEARATDAPANEETSESPATNTATAKVPRPRGPARKSRGGKAVQTKHPRTTTGVSKRSRSQTAGNRPARGH